MKRLATCLLVLIAATQTVQSAQVNRIEFLKCGVSEKDGGDEDKVKKNATISTGQTFERKQHIAVPTNVIATKPDVDVNFGCEVAIIGTPKNTKVPIRVVWRYPQPGMTNPATGVTKMRDEYVIERIVGEKTIFAWNLVSDWTKVPGPWTLELWNDQRLLASQTLTVTK